MANNGRNANYRVGYGKPPKHSQFKKGTSGNKKGRSKGSKNFATLFHQEMRKRVPISENGQRRTISKAEAVIKQLVNKAASGDPKAIQMLTNLSREFGDLKQPDVAAPPTVQRVTVRVFEKDWDTGEEFEVRPGTRERVHPPREICSEEDGDDSVA